MAKLKVLIIDDELDFCMIMQRYFQGKNYEVFLGKTIKDCLKSLRDTRPDILLLDNNLPDGKGWELIDLIREKYPALRIYLISAYHQKADPLPRYENVTVWEKPISFSQLNQAFA